MHGCQSVHWTIFLELLNGFLPNLACDWHSVCCKWLSGMGKTESGIIFKLILLQKYGTLCNLNFALIHGIQRCKNDVVESFQIALSGMVKWLLSPNISLQAYKMLFDSNCLVAFYKIQIFIYSRHRV